MAARETQRIITIDSRAISGPVKVTGYIASANGRVVYSITQCLRVRRAGDTTRKPSMIRLVLERVSRATLPDNVEVAMFRTGWRPSKALPALPVPRIPATKDEMRIRKSREADANRRRIRSLLSDDADDHRAVPSIRKATITDHTGRVLREPTAERGEWIDPDDMRPNRRTPKMVSGFRAIDVLQSARKRNSLITKKHIKAAQHLRQAYDLGIEGARPGYVRPEVGTAYYGGQSGPQEMQLMALQSYENARAALGPLFPILLHVVLLNLEVTTFRNLGRQAMGYLVAALDALVDHYDPPKERNDHAE